MPDNLRTSIEITFSERDDFRDPEWITNWADFDLTPEGAETRKLEIGTVSETIDLGDYSLITAFALKNLGGNIVTATFEGAATGGNSNIVQIAAGGFLYLTDVVAVADIALISTGAPNLVKIMIAGET